MNAAADWLAFLDVDHPGYMPALDHGTRRDRLRAGLARLAPEGASAALLVTGRANLRWASGFTGSNGQLLVLPDRCLLLTDARYEGRAAVECHGLEVEIARPLTPRAVEIAAAAGVDRLVFEGDHVTFAEGAELQSLVAATDLADVVSAHGVVEAERLVKDDAELARLARACAVTEVALEEVLGEGLAGRTEREVANALEAVMRRHDAAVGFPTIVAAGGNGAVPHHEPTSRVIATGDLVTVDCGARVDGYHADTTRTVAAGALPSGSSAGLQGVFEAVARAQQRGVEAAVAGADARAVDRACRDLLTDEGHGAAFLHGTGHGIGLDVHEAPAVAATSTATLGARTTLTVEPGVYLPGQGGVRIEDTVVVTLEGPARRLTNSPRTLLVV